MNHNIDTMLVLYSVAAVADAAVADAAAADVVAAAAVELVFLSVLLIFLDPY